MLNSVHAAVNAEEANANHHNGKLEGLGDACYAEKVGLVGNEEPGSRAGLGGNYAIAK